MKLTLSTLQKMWIIDVDGTIFIHNGHLNGEDILVPNFLEFYNQIDSNDFILLISARSELYKEVTLKALAKHGIRYNQIIFDAPQGERILINDTKPKGLVTAIAVANKRDKFDIITVEYNERL